MKMQIIMVACAAILLGGCKKEEIQKSDIFQPVPQLELSQRSIIIPADDGESGYLEIEIASNDVDYLESYIVRYDNTTISLLEVSSMEIEGKDQHKSPYDIDNELLRRQNELEKSGNNFDGLILNINLNWDNYKFKTIKGKNYELLFKNKNKALTYVTTFYNVSEVNSTAGLGAATVINTFSYWNIWCLCNQTSNTAQWNFGSTPDQNNTFYSRIMNKDDHLEVRTFTPPTYDPQINWLPYFNQNFSSFYYNGEQIWFNPRYNSTGLLMPIGSIDRNMIRNVHGLKNGSTKSATGNVKIFVAG